MVLHLTRHDGFRGSPLPPRSSVWDRVSPVKVWSVGLSLGFLVYADRGLDRRGPLMSPLFFPNVYFLQHICYFGGLISTFSPALPGGDYLRVPVRGKYFGILGKKKEIEIYVQRGSHWFEVHFGMFVFGTVRVAEWVRLLHS